MTHPDTPGSASAPLVIAVAGVGPRTGVTTTALALAQCRPVAGTASLLVEADERGGQLAALIGADPYLGLSSLARSLDPDTTPVRPERLVGHVQYLPGGVALLAAPPGRDPARAAVAAALLAGPGPGVRVLGATIVADCGSPEPDTRLAPVLAAADACLVVVRADRVDPDHAARRIHRLTAHSPHRGVILLGADPRVDYARVLAVPVVGTLPLAPAAADALPYGTRAPRGRALLPAARNLAAGLYEQLRPPTRPRPPSRSSVTVSGHRPAAPPPAGIRPCRAYIGSTRPAPTSDPAPHPLAYPPHAPPRPDPPRPPPPTTTTPSRATRATTTPPNVAFRHPIRPLSRPRHRRPRPPPRPMRRRIPSSRSWRSRCSDRCGSRGGHREPSEWTTSPVAYSPAVERCSRYWPCIRPV
ncbi:hypothetical protein [Nocardia takedensis]|uniref:hypothetical protein n=1 Tax=Nocardia takedensis TaxID=259390 RepID=UPI0002DA2B45|nr:hypothetical protein [Nocardia takedensis]